MIRVVRAVFLFISAALFIAILYLAITDMNHKAPDFVYASGDSKEPYSESPVMQAVYGSVKEIGEMDRSVRMKSADIAGSRILVGAKYINRRASERSAQRKNAAKAGELGLIAMQAMASDRMSYDDYLTLLQIVEAEATGGGEDSKLAIANVVLNRVADERFPDTVSEVVWQNEDGFAQFTPTVDGRIYSCQITKSTINAVQRALDGEDISDGALFFAARSHADSDLMSWFDQSLVKLFDLGGHEFYSFRDDI